MHHRLLEGLALASLTILWACDSGAPPEPKTKSPARVQASAPTASATAAPSASAPSTAGMGAAAPPAPPAPRPITVALSGRSGSELAGSVSLAKAATGVTLSVRVEGGKKGSYSVALHDKADCSAKDASSVGDAWSGAPPAGDAGAAPGVIGTVEVGDEGKGELSTTLAAVSLDGGASDSILEHALVLTDKKKRVGCAELRGPHPGLLDPSKASEKAPETFKAKFDTTKGSFVVQVTRKWSPNGADRFYNLVKIGFFDDVSLFRAVDGFMVQFGISGDPEVSRAWRNASIRDDEVVESNKTGFVTFAKTSMPNSRSTQLFINYGDNERLDKMGFAPIGKIVEGMSTVESFYKGYGEQTTQRQGEITAMGNAYLKEHYPKLDYIVRAKLVD